MCCNLCDNDHDLLSMQDRLYDRISAANPEIAEQFKQFTAAYRNRVLYYRDLIPDKAEIAAACSRSNGPCARTATDRNSTTLVSVA